MHALAALVALPLLTFAPPAEGRILLLPLPGAAEIDAASLFRAALPLGAQPLGAGPVPGSLIVEGRRNALFGPMLRRGVLLAAAAPAGCLGSSSSESGPL